MRSLVRAQSPRLKIKALIIKVTLGNQCLFLCLFVPVCALALALGGAVVPFAHGAAITCQGGGGDDDGVEEIFEHGGEEVKEEGDLLSTL